MKAVMLRARAELRSRLPAMLALAILLGLGAGTVMTLTAGARRTDSAYPRFAKEYRGADMLLYPAFDESFASLDFSAVEKLPGVVASARDHLMFTSGGNITVIARDQVRGEVNLPKMLEGRLPRDDRMEETAISFVAAKNQHLHLGSTLVVNFGGFDHSMIPQRLRVVGIEASPGEFPPSFQNSTIGKAGAFHVSPALFESLKSRVFGFEFLLLRFRNGSADFASFNEKLSVMAGDKPQLNQNLAAQAANVLRSIHLQAVALRIVGGLVALIGLLVLTQLVARQAALDATDTPTLLALGMTRREIALSGLSRSAMIGGAGAVIAAASAFAASPLMPIGTARVAEPNTGLSFDPLILGVGAIAVVAFYLAISAVPLWRSTRSVREVASRESRLSLPARSATLVRFPPPMAMGVRLALETGRGRTAVPVRSSLFSVALAIVALAGALTFGAGLDHLLDNPRQYGWGWDMHVSVQGDTGEEAGAATTVMLAAMKDDPDIAAIALVDFPPMRVGDASFDAIALQREKGVIEPVVLSGRPPRDIDEIALGVRTMREAHAHLGSTVRASIAAVSGGGAAFTVVGTVVIPPNSDTARLGGGGVVTYEGFRRMVPPNIRNLSPPSEIYFNVASGVNIAKVKARLERTYGDKAEIPLPERPVDLVNFGQVQNLPVLLAGLVGALAAATLVHTLVTAIRRRRRDLAILKMIGFVPRQVRGAVAWQATTFVSAALLIGLPIGIVVGRLIWTVFAHQLGTLADPVTPSVQLLLTIPGAVILANLVAMIPAVMAGRMKPAPALRAE